MKIHEDPPYDYEKVLKIFPDWLAVRFIANNSRWFMVCRSIRKQSAWFVLCAIHGSTAKAVSSPWRPVSGVLEQHATGTVHHLGNEHRRAGAESAISLLILVLVVLAVEITALWNKHVFFFFHRRTIDRNKFFTIFKILKHNGIKENFSFKFYPLFYYTPTIFVSER